MGLPRNSVFSVPRENEVKSPHISNLLPFSLTHVGSLKRGCEQAIFRSPQGRNSIRRRVASGDFQRNRKEKHDLGGRATCNDSSLFL